jgi:23S rRNA (cytosine1962-C5)-methyltransferase
MTTNASAPTVSLFLSRHRERALLRGNPWIFSGAVGEIRGPDAEKTGALAEVFASDGTRLGTALWEPGNGLCARLLSRGAEPLDGAWLARTVRRAFARRQSLPLGPGTDSYRAIFSEADGLSGVVCDVYADAASLVLSPGWGPRADELAAVILSIPPIRTVFIAVEGEEPRVAGVPRYAIDIRESGFRFRVRPQEGQKTGFYLDQRENRRRVALHAMGRKCLSAYCYTGAFELALARGGAESVLGIDSSSVALEEAEAAAERNELESRIEHEEADVPERLRLARDRGETYGLIVLDPPRLVTGKGNLERGLRLYKDINLLAMKLLEPEGILATFSCSGLVDRAIFERTLSYAAHDAGRKVCILESLGQPADHPVPLDFPEAAYLKGAICRVS